MTDNPPQLAIIVPCYNEEDVLASTTKKLVSCIQHLLQLKKIDSNSKVIYIDDGSKDNTWDVIEQLALKNNCISGIKLSRNCGHQNALLAGLFTAKGDALISIDADLQDDVEVIESMIDDYLSGSEIVYGVRSNRQTDTFFKRNTASLFYKLMLLLGVDVIDNHADFRLMSRMAVEKLKEFKEVNLFIRGLIPLIGFSSSVVEYERKERTAGNSKYPFFKMLGFALNGITSFSIVPLRMITVLGVLLFIVSMLISGWVLGVKLFTDSSVPGWASTVLPIYFIGGIQIFCIGIIGEYLGKLYMESKNRPRYIIEKELS